jgi:hypothetical protein
MGACFQNTKTKSESNTNNPQSKVNFNINNNNNINNHNMNNMNNINNNKQTNLAGKREIPAYEEEKKFENFEEWEGILFYSNRRKI